MKRENFTTRIARVGVTAATTANVLAALPLARLLGETDSWRRTVGLGLRSEAAKFGLSAFGLKLPQASGSDFEATFARQFADFIFQEPEARWALHHRAHHVERVPWPCPDLVLGKFRGAELESLIVFPHPTKPKPDARAEAEVLAAHRATRDLPEARRPREMLARAASPDARRLMSAAFLSVEMVDVKGRFAPPDFCARRSLGLGFLNFIARPAPGGASTDLWLNIHHTGSDGAPMQEMFSRLERAWGCESVNYPADNPESAPFLASCQTPAADRPMSLLADFIDFGPLLRHRVAVNARLGNTLGQPVPLAALLLWHMTRQPEFAGRRISTTVDVPAEGAQGRGVDLVAIRPGDYHSEPDGLTRFARDYLRLLERARERKSPSYAAMRAGALAHPALALRMLRLDPARNEATFGTLGLTVLKDAKVFTAPMADMSFEDGFIAIGGAGLPSENGGTVAAVTIKGAPDKIRSYPSAIRAAIRQSAT